MIEDLILELEDEDDLVMETDDVFDLMNDTVKETDVREGKRFHLPNGRAMYGTWKPKARITRGPLIYQREFALPAREYVSGRGYTVPINIDNLYIETIQNISMVTFKYNDGRTIEGMSLDGYNGSSGHYNIIIAYSAPRIVVGANEAKIIIGQANGVFYEATVT